MFNDIMMKISVIYVSIAGYRFHSINIRQQRINSQHCVLACPVLHNISIDTYKQKILPTIMLADSVYITCPLNWVKVEELSKI